MEGFDNNPSEPALEDKKRSRVPLIITILFFIFLIVILIILIYILIHFKNVTIEKNEKSESIKNKVPIIAITGMRVFNDSDESFFSADQTQIHYIEAIEKAGGIPISLPVLKNFNKESIRRQVEVIDGLLIQGGLDVDPSLYHEDKKPLIGDTNLLTDNFIIEAIKQAKERKIPILGICRGFQILNVAFGGTLHQDLSYAGLDTDFHRQSIDTMDTDYKHTINVEENSLLSKMFPNNKTLYVNSFHHQAINKLAEGFVVDAKAEDGIIESFHLESDEQWIFGVQFHPEQYMRRNNDFLPIFSELINQAKKTSS